MKTIAKNISYYMQLKNLKQKELADLVGITESAISRYLQGNREPKVTVLSKIADVLDVTIDMLYECEKWKSCKCEMPKNWEKVLVYTLFDEIDIDIYSTIGGWKKHSCVTHWQPLPKRPIESEETGE